MIEWTHDANKAFSAIKEELLKSTVLAYPGSEAPTRLVTDASDLSMDAALEQFLDDQWKPLAFFSRKFNSAQIRCSKYDREFTAIYEAVKFFRYFLEGRIFLICTDHKPLIYMFTKSIEKSSPRQQRQISYLSQFTHHIEHITGEDKAVADALSRVEAVAFPPEFSLTELSKTQSDDAELKSFLQNKNVSLSLKELFWGPDQTPIICDVSGDTLRPFVPKALRTRIMHTFYSPAHLSGKITDRIIRKKFVWPAMHNDIKLFCQSCLNCQKSNISRHTALLPSHIIAPAERFRHVHIVGPLLLSDRYGYCFTMTDRFSRWPEAVPLKDIESLTICRAFASTWISRFGTPETVSTDQGLQFESQLFKALLQLSGTHRIRTTPIIQLLTALLNAGTERLKPRLSVTRMRNGHMLYQSYY